MKTPQKTKFGIFELMIIAAIFLTIMFCLVHNIIDLIHVL